MTIVIGSYPSEGGTWFWIVEIVFFKGNILTFIDKLFEETFNHKVC